MLFDLSCPACSSGDLSADAADGVELRLLNGELVGIGSDDLIEFECADCGELVLCDPSTVQL